MKQPFLLKLLKNIDVKNSNGVDKLHPKLVKCPRSTITSFQSLCHI